jgi:NAD-dependent SIR2 family protein deacetylase
MHGNVKYMHCSNESEECSRKFYLAPTLEEVNDRTNHVPKCPVCQFPMKPHAMFFDETYNEHYYRHETTKKIEFNETDCLIVIGTALATSGARTFVFNTLRKNDIPVIEFNLEPQCDVGFSL